MKNLILYGVSLLIHAAGYAQLQNTDFEIWVNPVTSTISTNRPVGWLRSNGYPNNPYINFYHPPTTAAQSGNYALKLSVWYSYDLDMATQVAPINYRPTSLTGYYTYTDNEVYDDGNVIINDVAKVTVKLTKVDPTTGIKVLIGSGITQLNAAQTYTQFTCVINYVSNDIPDTVEVEFDCTLMDKMVGPNVLPINTSGICSILTIDNIELTTSLSAEKFSLSNIKMYPNPTTGIVNIPDFEGTVRIYDEAGKLVLSTFARKGTIDIGGVSNGIYILSLTNESGTHNTKIVKR